ncbi:MAG: CDP-alcohol phosphatidyltransferase family protein [Nostocaceae cyanobacterium]|nr:CDP-alcohol phosphatidyltransferase family protein [Nostocaceae cyanobacterium]
MTTKPWDAQLAYRLILPLQDSWVTPNHLTTVRLVTGLSAAAALAVGNPTWNNIGAGLFVLSNFLDHTDGELARVSGKTSKFGYLYDLISDAIINTLFFVGIGYAMRNSQLGLWALLMGIISGLSVACIFTCIFLLHNNMEQRQSKAAIPLPKLSGFEIEDILYLFPIVVILDSLVPFLTAATIGAPAFALWVIWQYRSLVVHHTNFAG